MAKRKTKKHAPSEFDKLFKTGKYTEEKIDWNAISGRKRRRTIVILSALAIGVVIAVGAAVYFSGFYKPSEGLTKSSEPFAKPTMSEEETEEIQTSLYQEFCRDYPKIAGEISCEKATVFAVKKYPGEIISINKTLINSVDRETGEPSVHNVWLVEIDFNTPLQFPGGSSSRGEVIVDITTWNVNLYKAL